MFKYTKSNLVILVAMCLMIGTQAAVIRNSAEEMMDSKVEATTLEGATEEAEMTTLESVTDEISTDAPEELPGALTRDEEATILIIDQTILDSEPAESRKSEAPVATEQKFGKLLLLSTPKLAEKPKLPEENFEESEETLDTAENSTDSTVEMTTTTSDGLKDEEEESTTLMAEIKEEATKEAEVMEEATKEADAMEETTKEAEAMEEATKMEEEKPQTPVEIMETMETIEPIATTKLYPINDTLYEENKKSNSQEMPEPSAVIVMDEEPKDVKNSNLAAIVLGETEADYILVDSDTEILEEGVYADADSELHLQPIVQSLEIVPTSVDDSLLVNYVHNW